MEYKLLPSPWKSEFIGIIGRTKEVVELDPQNGMAVAALNFLNAKQHNATR